MRLQRRGMCAVAITALCFLVGATPADAKRLVFGRSVQGRPLVAWAFGSPHARRRVLVVGCIHGNECAGLAITSALRHQSVPPGATWSSRK